MNTNENSHKNLDDLGGKWSGKTRLTGEESEIDVYFTTGRINSATIKFPHQDVNALPLVNADYKAPKIHFEYVTREVRGVFDGTLDRDKMTGNFSQNNISGSFELFRNTDGDDSRNNY